MTAPLARPPTSLRGYVDDALSFSTVLADWQDHVPDCLWPTSIDTYRQMRTHPQLAAVERAYTLPIRRASWTVDPAGCRPDVVALVADDLGLPVAGVDEPSAARTRGVSWAEHLRLALLVLPFGHSGFEMLAEMRGGQARLVELSERLPSTIAEIHTDKVGRLAGITQHAAAAGKGPSIKADRLVWHVREREGAAWWGRSVLRPAFAAWLLSREMLRVHATANRRFGMGVPVVRALPGTTETPAQAAAAAGLAQQIRVGDQGGASLPPGYVLDLVGLSGGTPDTLAFLRYLDQSMARMALVSFLDLGTTESGSRALASEFIDMFTLALQSEADSIADTVTRQAAARLVLWNWGPDEPVPAVRCADVGSRREVTAEALRILLDSGAVAADPALEAWVRREYRLPPRETPRPAPADGQGTPGDGDAELGETGNEDHPGAVAAAVGVGHPDTCEQANLISVWRCDCTGTRHGETRSRTRLGRIRAEQVERAGGSVRLAGASDDELGELFAQHSAAADWDALAAVDAEMARREESTRAFDASPADEHWDTGGEPSEEDRRIDALVARGYDFVEAYAEVHGRNEQRLRAEERSAGVDRAGAESTEQAVRRGYDMWVHEQWLQAEQDTRGHLLTREGRAAGVDPVELFSGPAARARRYASEDLQRWWADNGRLTFVEWRAQVLGRRRDRDQAERTRLGRNARDFV